MNRTLLFAALVALAMVPALVAQQNPGNRGNGSADRNQGRPQAPQPIVVWKAELPGGSYVVARNAISAISTQQYILDGAARVTEVNISTSGAFQPRFYYIEPLAATAIAALPAGQALADHAQTQVQSAVSRVVPGDPIWAKVVKNYPSTTHAGTIEFRLETRDQLDKLYASVERTWVRGKSEVFTPAGAKPYHSQKKSEEDGADDQNASTPDETASDETSDSGNPN